MTPVKHALSALAAATLLCLLVHSDGFEVVSVVPGGARQP